MKTNKTLKVTAIVVAIITLVLLAAVFAAAISMRQFEASQRIAGNVTIAGVPVGGMTEQQAVETVRSRLQASLPQQIELHYGDGKTLATRHELGAELLIQNAAIQATKIGRTGRFFERLGTHLRLRRTVLDIPLQTRVSKPKLRAFVAALRPLVDCLPEDAEITISDDDEVRAKPGQVGRVLRIEESVAAVATALADPWVAAVDLAVDLTPPEVTTEQLEDIEVVLSSYSTKFNPGKVNRTHNLRLGIATVNKTAIEPNQIFSLNEVVGERAPGRGYRAALIFRESDVRPETGGGMCQVSSTIYNAALLAGLEMTERFPHQRPVDYIPMGRDATVYWGSKDLKFKNSLAHTIMLMGGIEGNTLWVKILGKAEDKLEVKLFRTGVARGSFRIIEKPDPDLPEGKKVRERPGSAGGTATLWREIYKDGKLIKKEKLHTDHYPSIAKIVRVGVKGAEGAQEGEAAPGTEEPRPSEAGLVTDDSSTTTPSPDVPTP